jgi:squalene synthase HpnC
LGIPNFASELERWGPKRPDGRVVAQTEAEAYCRALARSTYENFSVATWLLPAALRQHFYNLYAYCRWADDLADESTSLAEAMELLDWWQGELDQMFAGRASHPVFVALRQTVEAARCQKQPFDDLLAAFRRDQTQKRYETFDDLLTYCRCSANPVGRIVLRIANEDSPENIALSDSVCTGLQLINFCQDVARDWQIGRLYLPLEDLRQHGIDVTQSWENDSPAFRAMLSEQVARAKRFLIAGQPLVDTVGPLLRRQIDVFVQSGLAIAKAINDIDFAVWRTRPTVSKWAKLGIVWRAFLRTSRATSSLQKVAASENAS